MAQSHEAKQKAYRIEHDYHRRPDPTQRVKLWATALVLVVTLAVLLWLLVVPGETNRWHTPGPVAEPHAMFDNQCRACHVEFTPVRSDATPLLSPAHASEQPWDSPTDQKCQHCHRVARHHAAELPGEVAGCAACHRDHQGRDFSLTNVSDTACLACHSEMKLHTASSQQTIAAANVSGFPAGHPEFRSLQTDPGLIKFPHDVHMLAGQPRFDPTTGQYTQPLKKLADLPADQKQRYRKADQTSDLVQLACADCHVPDHSHDTRLAGQLSIDGRQMQPIRYDVHCQACHPLALPGGVEVPHGLPLAELRQRLEQELTAELIASEAPRWLADSPALDPVPGEPTPEDMAALRQRRDEQLAKSLMLVRSACAQCHHMQGDEVQVAEPMIPIRWFQHAQFDHGAHRTLSCQACHAGAALDPSLKAGEGPLASHTSADVLIAGKQLCAQCHRPAVAGAGSAGNACSECHGYHGGSHAIHSGLLASDGMLLEAFLRGGEVGQPAQPGGGAK